MNGIHVVKGAAVCLYSHFPANCLSIAFDTNIEHKTIAAGREMGEKAMSVHECFAVFRLVLIMLVGKDRVVCWDGKLCAIPRLEGAPLERNCILAYA